MKIAVMGTGGMGGYYGGLLASVGEDVSFIARGEHLKALKSDGLLLKGDGEEMHLKPIMATEEQSEIESLGYSIEKDQSCNKDIEGLEKLEGLGPAVYVSNHAS